MPQIVSIVAFTFVWLQPFSQDHIFLDEMPHALRMTVTTDTNLLEKGFVYDAAFGEKYDYNLYRKEQDVFAYTKKSNGKLFVLKLWQVPESWRSAGIEIGMSQWDLTYLLKNEEIPFRKKNFRLTNYVHVKWKELQYEFSFPTLDYTTTEYPQYRDRLQYVVIRVIDPHNKAMRRETVFY